ncbi:DNA-binding MarR family transcriptional regulator [Pseudomonas sp. HLS-6 TE3448]
MLVLKPMRVYTRTMLTSQCLCTHLRRAARGVSRRYDEALEGFGINVAQFSLLRHLQRLDRPSISSLAEAMGLDRSTLGRNLRVLEADGLVALAEGDDLRNRLVLLTEQGKARLSAAEPAWEQAQLKMLAALGEAQRDELVRLLKQLA